MARGIGARSWPVICLGVLMVLVTAACSEESAGVLPPPSVQYLTFELGEEFRMEPGEVGRLADSDLEIELVDALGVFDLRCGDRGCTGVAWFSVRRGGDATPTELFFEDVEQTLTALGYRFALSSVSADAAVVTVEAPTSQHLELGEEIRFGIGDVVRVAGTDLEIIGHGPSWTIPGCEVCTQGPELLVRSGSGETTLFFEDRRPYGGVITRRGAFGFAFFVERLADNEVMLRVERLESTIAGLGEDVHLTTSQAGELPEVDLEVELVRAYNGFELYGPCCDISASATIVVRVGGQEIELPFSQGGISGDRNLPQLAFGYWITVVEFGNDEATLRVDENKPIPHMGWLAGRPG